MMFNLIRSAKYDSWTQYFQGDSLFKNAVRLQSLIQVILKYAKPGDKLLEAGCGSGNTGVLLSDLQFNITLFDIEEGLFDFFIKRFPIQPVANRVRLVRGNMYDMPFSNQSFDLVYHQGVLEHLSDTQIVRALNEQRRIGRLVVIDVPNSKYTDHPFGDERLIPVENWIDLIRQAGMQVIQISGRRLPRWTYLLPHVLFLLPFTEKLELGKRLGTVSIFVCQSIK